MRGEDAVMAKGFGWLGETPPHAWGRLPLPCVPFINDRNTPTCVGKTFLLLRTVLVHQKHPHMRGEDSFRLRLQAWRRETPPHAWGRRQAPRVPHRPHGNTPTCVGKTNFTDSNQAMIEKHPHMRGEDMALYILVCSTLETPPHAWGRP